MLKMPWTFKLKTWGKKLTALSFILLILIGNLWVIYRFTGESLPQWTIEVFFVGVAIVFMGFLMMVPDLFNPAENTSESTEDSKKDNSPG